MPFRGRCILICSLEQRGLLSCSCTACAQIPSQWRCCSASPQLHSLLRECAAGEASDRPKQLTPWTAHQAQLVLLGPHSRLCLHTSAQPRSGLCKPISEQPDHVQLTGGRCLQLVPLSTGRAAPRRHATTRPRPTSWRSTGRRRRGARPPLPRYAGLHRVCASYVA